MHEHADDLGPQNRALRFLAILSAARDFGLSRHDIERAARRFDPFTADPRMLAAALADALFEAEGATPVEQVPRND
jgi:hypothetical protein